MTIDTGLDVHVSMPVDKEWAMPNAEALECAKNNIRGVAHRDGKRIGAIKHKWVDVTGLGYDKNWMFVIGCNYRA